MHRKGLGKLVYKTLKVVYNIICFSLLLMASLSLMAASDCSEAMDQGNPRFGFKRSLKGGEDISAEKAPHVSDPVVYRINFSYSKPLEAPKVYRVDFSCSIPLKNSEEGGLLVSQADSSPAQGEYSSEVIMQPCTNSRVATASYRVALSGSSDGVQLRPGAKRCFASHCSAIMLKEPCEVVLRKQEIQRISTFVCAPVLLKGSSAAFEKETFPFPHIKKLFCCQYRGQYVFYYHSPEDTNRR